MRKFQIGLVKRVYYDEHAAFELIAENEEDAKKKALYYSRKNGDSIAWNAECLTQRPRPKVEQIADLGEVEASVSPKEESD